MNSLVIIDNHIKFNIIISLIKNYHCDYNNQCKCNYPHASIFTIIAFI